MTEILSAVSPSVFSWTLLGRRSSAAFLLPRPENGVWWPTPCRRQAVRVAAVALKLTDLVSISRNAATGRATWRHLSFSPFRKCEKHVAHAIGRSELMNAVTFEFIKAFNILAWLFFEMAWRTFMKRSAEFSRKKLVVTTFAIAACHIWSQSEWQKTVPPLHIC